jgi:hypothetical protein
MVVENGDADPPWSCVNDEAEFSGVAPPKSQFNKSGPETKMVGHHVLDVAPQFLHCALGLL